MSCQNAMPYLTPSELLRLDFPLLYQKEGTPGATFS